MPALNRVQLIGRLGRDPESRYTPTGKKVTHFSVAVSNRWKGRDGEIRESTEWINVEAWERLGETCQEYLKKGSLVYVDGRLKTDKYEDRGDTRYFTKVVAQMVQFLDNRTAAEELAEQTDDSIGEEELDLTEAF